MKKNKFLKHNKGVVLVNSLIILLILIVLGVTLISLILANSNYIKKEALLVKAQNIAEGGIEKALWELNQEGSTYNGENNNTSIPGGAFDIEIQDIDSNNKYIIATGYVPSKTNYKAKRKIRVKATAKTSETGVAFRYAIQVGGLGVVMSNNAKVLGNIYSNGNIIGGNGSEITGDAFVSGNGNKIAGTGNAQRLTIGHDAHAHTLQYLNINNDAYYFSSSTLISCTVLGTKYPDYPNPETKNLPISQETINQWEEAAKAGGTIEGDYILSGFTSANLGPKKINGNMIIENGATLNITGVIWVTGNINFSNGAIIKLDPSYGAKSGMIIADNPIDKTTYGKITVQNNVIVEGSGNSKSYIMMLSTNLGSNISNPAILAGNNSNAVIYYTTTGFIEISNNAYIKAVSGGGLHLSNNAIVQYDSGLADASFSTGPGGAWVIKKPSWENF